MILDASEVCDELRRQSSTDYDAQWNIRVRSVVRRHRTFALNHLSLISDQEYSSVLRRPTNRQAWRRHSTRSEGHSPKNFKAVLYEFRINHSSSTSEKLIARLMGVDCVLHACAAADMARQFNPIMASRLTDIQTSLVELTQLASGLQCTWPVLKKLGMEHASGTSGGLSIIACTGLSSTHSTLTSAKPANERRRRHQDCTSTALSVVPECIVRDSLIAARRGRMRIAESLLFHDTLQ